MLPLIDWSATSFEALTPEHFEALLTWKPEIVILGTGASLRFPHPRMTQPLAKASAASSSVMYRLADALLPLDPQFCL